jgi:protein-tyrosine phosphatase
VIDRALDWPACANARDLGGLPRAGGVTRRGALVRSDCITYLTDAGRQAMCSYGVTTVIDLRSSGEINGTYNDERFPRPEQHLARADGVTYVHCALVDDASMKRLGEADNMLDRYLMMLGHRQEAFRDIFTAIANSEGGLLFHCFAGKDRTGLVAAMVLSLAGVPDEHIGADFAATDAQLAAKYEEWIAATAPDQRAAMREELRCPPERILAVLEHLRRTSGGVASYLEAAGVSPADIDSLASRLA